MSTLLIAGSPSERSRSAALLDAVAQRLTVRGALVDRIHVRDLSPQALLLAVGLAVINPKNLALAFSTILSLAEAPAAPQEARLALVLFVLIGSSTIAVPVFYRLIAGKQADRQLQAWKEWLTYNNATVVCVVLLMIGMMIIGKGVGGLL